MSGGPEKIVSKTYRQCVNMEREETKKIAGGMAELPDEELDQVVGGKDTHYVLMDQKMVGPFGKYPINVIKVYKWETDAAFYYAAKRKMLQKFSKNSDFSRNRNGLLFRGCNAIIPSNGKAGRTP